MDFGPTHPPDGFTWSALVVELLVADLTVALRFWCGLLDFVVAYTRPDERFAYLALGEAQVMLEQRDERQRQWVTAPLERPLGRGLHLQISVPAITPVLDELARARWPVFMAPEERWYAAGAIETGVRQFLVQDPDGYLLRLVEDLGTRPASKLRG